MAWTTAGTRRLEEIRAEIAQIEARLCVSHAMGDSHSSQGISATFNDNQRWRNRLSILRSTRDRLEAQEIGAPVPAPAGVNLSFYRPDSGKTAI